MQQAIKLGVISDTHRLMRPEALAALEGSDVIIHAGDVGSPEVLEKLEKIAPVHAIRGNIDIASWARHLPEQREVSIENARIWVLHDRQQLAFDPAAAGYRAVISGHSHQPKIEQNGAVLYLNPGSAGPRRFRLPVSLARCEVRGGEIRAELIELAV
jgi:putative phosphoesterase